MSLIFFFTCHLLAFEKHNCSYELKQENVVLVLFCCGGGGVFFPPVQTLKNKGGKERLFLRQALPHRRLCADTWPLLGFLSLS